MSCITEAHLYFIKKAPSDRDASQDTKSYYRKAACSWPKQIGVKLTMQPLTNPNSSNLTKIIKRASSLRLSRSMSGNQKHGTDIVQRNNETIIVLYRPNRSARSPAMHRPMHEAALRIARSRYVNAADPVKASP
ncbi:hypothetical protein BPOR_0152g00160 [Botrytis porri]|uniref:Uncharacterized protein n=1 Tax=Botrytis porri TaxID=87229 RepID=A0A4Z1KVR9_9HELO|nr:hypothetical protein BPOR_0152g00160 [Botrytis porri]